MATCPRCTGPTGIIWYRSTIIGRKLKELDTLLDNEEMEQVTYSAYLENMVTEDGECKRKQN